MDAKSGLVIFQEKQVRRIWYKNEWWYSVVDIIQILTNQPTFQRARNYWKVLKNRLTNEGSQTVTSCNRLKMKAEDGKMRYTDTANTQILLRLIQSIPSPKAEPFKLWLAQVVKNRGGSVAGVARKETEKEIGKSVITNQNYLK